MTKVVKEGVIFYEVEMGGTTFLAFDPQELIVRMAQINLSLN
jgi:hypothetical protein